MGDGLAEVVSGGHGSLEPWINALHKRMAENMFLNGTIDDATPELDVIKEHIKRFFWVGEYWFSAILGEGADYPISVPDYGLRQGQRRRSAHGHVRRAEGDLEAGRGHPCRAMQVHPDSLGHHKRQEVHGLRVQKLHLLAVVRVQEDLPPRPNGTG